MVTNPSSAGVRDYSQATLICPDLVKENIYIRFTVWLCSKEFRALLMQELILLMPFPGARTQMLLQEINTFTQSILNHTFATWPGMEQRSISSYLLLQIRSTLTFLTMKHLFP